MQTSPHRLAPAGHGPDASTTPLSRTMAPSGRAIGAPHPTITDANARQPCVAAIATAPLREIERDCIVGLPFSVVFVSASANALEARHQG